MPFTPDSLLALAEEEVRRALCSPEAAGADPCMALSEKASASDPGEVPTATIAQCLLSLAHMAHMKAGCPKSTHDAEVK